MTTIALCSLKGAPGVTTLACLLGAAWSGTGPVVLVEADPAGGDCAARFGLSARVGWTSLSASARRNEAPVDRAPHLQLLPGGLPVLVGARGEERLAASSVEGRALWSSGRDPVDGPSSDAADPPGGRGLTLVDLGRTVPGDAVTDSWMHAAEVTLVVVRGDAASALHVRNRIGGLATVAGDRIRLVAVGGPYRTRDLEGFAGVPVLGHLPFDLAAAEVASGSSGSGRRLERSPLWAAVERLADTLADDLEVDRCPPGASVGHAGRTDPGPGAGAGAGADADVHPPITADRGRSTRRAPLRAVLDRLAATTRRTADHERVDA